MGWTLVTGGSRGLGSEICLGLAEKGYPIIIHFHERASEAAAVAEKCRLKGVPAETIGGDLATLASTKQFIGECKERFFGIEHLVNNVGEYLCKSALETTPEQWLQLFQSNLHAPFMLIEAFLTSIKQAQGSIVNVGVAGAGVLQADVRRCAYRMAKMSLCMLTKSLAKELAAEHVRVNMVSPGYLENSVDLPVVWPAHSMQRAGLHKEVVRVIAFLLDEESRYISGQNIEVAGGVAL